MTQPGLSAERQSAADNADNVRCSLPPVTKRYNEFRMFDPSTMGAALASLKAIVDLVKNANDAQLTLRVSREVIEAQGKLFDAQQQALAVQSENQQLRAEIGKFRSSVFHHSVNWRVLPDGPEDGPFCPICAGEGVDMRLTPDDVVDQNGEVWHLHCPKRHLAQAVPKELVPPNRYFLTPR
jgi:hypothetical protein